MDKIKIAIGSDHGGFDYKASIIKALQVKDTSLWIWGHILLNPVIIRL